ncbi:facilitated trehalose transporter Tret1-like [Phlebotomus argentipes]|uniref:facilitated trehalose transporter Tret1-like n=1 Tax=Phlebotomus argentipes TaxID=94469 RepID=UPI00289300E0|nr:facilitated trehalose transporter Tret1-like [Phlebotomus argentipes]
MEWKIQLSGRFRQFLSAFLANFHTMVYAMVAIWPSPTLPKLLSENSPLPSGQISIAHASLISSILYFGGLLGTLSFGYIGKRFGQKLCLLLATIPEIAAALCIIFAQNVFYLHSSRFLSGVAGGAMQLIPAYVCEVSEDCIRGTLGSILGIVDCVGVLVGAVVGAYLPFYTAPYVFIILSGVSLLFIFFPESPQFLLLHKRIPEARRSFDFYRKDAPKEKVDEEFNHLRESIVDPEKSSHEEVTLKDFKNPSTIKALVISLVIFTGRQTSGIGVILNFNGLIFQETGMEMDPNLGTIIFAIVQLISFFSMSLYIDKLGRRPQLLGSLMGTFISYIPIATYFYAQNAGLDVSSFSGWVPLVGFSGVAIFSMGLIHTPTIIMTEIVPTKLRGTVVFIIYMVTRVQSILTMQFFLPLIEKFGLHTSMIAFATCIVLEAIFIYLYVPETKGRSVDDIVKTLNDKRNGKCNKSDC